MFRALALSAAALAAFATPSTATQARSFYVATLAEAPSATTLVTRNTVWKCVDKVCTAPRSGTRDQVMCELFVREAGTLTAFTVNGGALDAEALAKCNTRAR